MFFDKIFAELQEFVQKQSQFLEINYFAIPGIFEVQRVGRQQNENDPPPPQTQRDRCNYLCAGGEDRRSAGGEGAGS